MRNSIEEIKMLLLKFQEGYARREIIELDSFVNEIFVQEQEVSFLGTGLEEWFFGLNGVKEIIEEHWTNEERYLFDAEFDMDHANITIEGNTAFVALSGRSKQHIGEEKFNNRVLEEIQNRYKEEQTTKEECMAVAMDISRMLFEMSFGENYIWPFRMSAFLVYQDSKWRFKHLKFSFGACNGYETWFNDEDFHERTVALPVKNNKSSEDVEEIKKLLHILQEGYNKRDGNMVKFYAEQIFSNNDPMLIFGTDEGENFTGNDAGCKLLELDWKYWGDFDVNEEEAFISVCGDMAWVASKAWLRMNYTAQRAYSSLKSLLIDYLIPAGQSPKEVLLTMLLKTNKRVSDAEKGERWVVPMKFVGALIKKEGKWRFQHMHFSDPIDGMPEPRITE